MAEALVELPDPKRGVVVVKHARPGLSRRRERMGGTVPSVAHCCAAGGRRCETG